MEPYSNFKDICFNFQQLADYLGKSNEAKQIIAGVKKEISKLSNKNKNEDKNL